MRESASARAGYAPQTPFGLVLHPRSLGFQTSGTQGPLLPAFLQAGRGRQKRKYFLFIFEKERQRVRDGKDSSSPQRGRQFKLQNRKRMRMDAAWRKKGPSREEQWPHLLGSPFSAGHPCPESRPSLPSVSTQSRKSANWLFFPSEQVWATR